MVDGNRLGEVGFKYLGVSYSQMDCQAFVEQCLRDCGREINLAGSNAWIRFVMDHGWVGTPEECVQQHGRIPKGAFLFILEQDGKEPAKYQGDGIGNASHIGLVTMPEGEGAIHSSASRGCVCESRFEGKTIRNGGWNRVGLWADVAYDWGDSKPEPGTDKHTLRRGSQGAYVTLAQTKLIQMGYDLTPYGADGKFGAKTEAAVKQFQRDQGLEADGIVGPKTWEALDDGKAETYTVTVQHISRSVAEEIIGKYGGTMTKEEGT